MSVQTDVYRKAYALLDALRADGVAVGHVDEDRPDSVTQRATELDQALSDAYAPEAIESDPVERARTYKARMDGLATAIGNALPHAKASLADLGMAGWAVRVDFPGDLVGIVTDSEDRPAAYAVGLYTKASWEDTGDPPLGFNSAVDYPAIADALTAMLPVGGRNTRP